MTEQLIHLYTPVNYAKVDDPVTMSVFVSTVTGMVPIDTLTNSFTANFNDYSITSYICTYTDHIFDYDYKTVLNPATVTISASIFGVLTAQEFDVLRIDENLKQTELDVKRVNVATQVKLPYDLVYVPTNEWAVATTFNKVIDQLCDNVDYLIDLCKTYSTSPTRNVGWGDFTEFSPTGCFETTTATVTSTSSFFGVISNSNLIVKLDQILSSDYENGTSLFQVVSTATLTQIPTSTTSNLNKVYCSNINNRGVQLLTSTQLNYSYLISSAATNVPYTQTAITYPIVNSSGSAIVPVLTSYLLIKSCETVRLVPVYTLSGAVLPINSSYTAKTIDWHLENQYNYVPEISSANDFTNIYDIAVINNTDLYVARDSFIEKYDISTANKEMLYTTETIDISEVYTKAKSVAVSTDNRVYMLDNTRHIVHTYQVDSITGKIESISEWGSLGGATATQSFYKPNQLFIYDDKIYICDTGNKVIKKYNLQGNWEQTFSDFISASTSDKIISACIDKQDNIQILTETNLVTISSQGAVLRSTKTSFNSTPVKIITNYDGGLLYVCCEQQIYKLSLQHETVNFFANIVNYENLQKYVSITCDNNGSLYVTDGKYILKFLDIPDILQIRSNATNSQLWTREEIYIDSNEFVDEWVYNRSLRRIAENIDILYKSLENKIVPKADNTLKIEPINDKDTGWFLGLPVSLDDFCVIGINEFVTSEVLNRCVDNIQQNIFYILCLILNCFTANKLGLQVNFVVQPPTLPNCCWDWRNRVDGKCCTPWYWLTDNITWVHAENKSNGVLLSGSWLAIPGSQAAALNNITPNIAFSFWLSTMYFNPTGVYNLIGLTNTSVSNPGVMLQVSGSDLVANINGTYFATTGSVMNSTSAALTHIVFNKFREASIPKCEFYVNGVSNVYYDTGVPDAITVQLGTPITDTFMFGDSSVTYNNSFGGILHDIWLFKNGLTVSDVQTLSAKPAHWALTPTVKNKAIAHWYGNSEVFWIDDINAFNTTVNSGNLTTLNNLFGSCCEV